MLFLGGFPRGHWALGRDPCHDPKDCYDSKARVAPRLKEAKPGGQMAQFTASEPVKPVAFFWG